LDVLEKGDNPFFVPRRRSHPSGQLGVEFVIAM
jgi:hypothetical protein